MKNPFKNAGAGEANPQPEITSKSPIEDPSPGEDGVVLGERRATFEAHELKYIDEQLLLYKPLKKKAPGAAVFIDEAVRTEIELQRHNARVSKKRQEFQKTQKDVDAEWLIKMDRVGEGLMTRHTDALKAIGQLPKDHLMVTKEVDTTLSQVWLRYAKEIRRRNSVGNPIGRPSDAALELAESKGLKPSKYKTKPMPESERMKVVEEIESRPIEDESESTEEQTDE